MRRVAAWLSWFAGLLVLWLLLVGTVQYVERIAGLCAAAVGATGAEIVRSQGLLRFHVEWRRLRHVWRPLLRVVPEFAIVLAALVRRPHGTFRLWGGTALLIGLLPCGWRSRCARAGSTPSPRCSSEAP